MYPNSKFTATIPSNNNNNSPFLKNDVFVLFVKMRLPISILFFLIRKNKFALGLNCLISKYMDLIYLLWPLFVVSLSLFLFLFLSYTKNNPHHCSLISLLFFSYRNSIRSFSWRSVLRPPYYIQTQ